jgi:hypothetical protein
METPCNRIELVSDYPPDLPRLHTIATFLRVQLAAVEQLIAAEEPPPDWLVEHGIGDGRPAIRVHVGGCWDTQSRCKPADRDTIRRALADGVEACTHCRPDTALGVLD